MKTTIYKLEVLGSECPACQELYKRVVEAAKKLKLDTDILYSNDIQRIIDIGLQSAPILIINDEVALKRELLTVDDLVELLNTYNEDSHHPCAGCSGNCNCH